MAEEMRHHLAQRAAGYAADGLAPDEARFAAQRRFGNVASIQERARDARGWRWLGDFWSDARLGVRLLAKSPGFTAAAVVVLALGIGVNTAMFGVVHAIGFSARPFPAADRVVQLYSQSVVDAAEFRPFSHPVYRELRERTEVFAGVLAHTPAIVAVGEGADTRRALARIVSADYFDVLRVTLPRGRAFTAAEGQPGANLPVVIVSHSYWQRHGARPDLIGSTVRANDRLYSVIGVTPDGFSGTEMLTGPDFYFPLGVYDALVRGRAGGGDSSLASAEARGLFLVARLQTGVSRDAARAALRLLGENLARRFPAEQKDQTLTLGALPRLRTSPVPENNAGLALASVVLLGLSATVLLVVCLNLAGLQFARGHARRREFAVRLALGGGRGRIVRQLLTEGFVLALLGGGLGFLCAHGLLHAISAAATAQLPVSVVLTGSTTGAAVLATAGFAGLATLFFAVGPALRLARTDVIGGLKENAGEDAGVRRHPWMPRHPLLVLQIALTLALLICGGLFIRMASAAVARDPGYDADHTLIAEVDARLANYDAARIRETYRAIQERLAALPGVGAASLGAIAPFGREAGGAEVQRATTLPDDGRTAVRMNAVGADYFATLGLTLLRGRTFTAPEAAGAGDSPPVAIVDAALARKLWPGGEALGQSIQFAGYPGLPPSRPMEIVGIVSSARSDLWDQEPLGTIYLPFAQHFSSGVHFHVRPATPTAAAAQALRAPVREAIRAAAPGVPVFSVRTFRAHRDASLEVWSLVLVARLVAFFGGATLLIATVGIYGVQAYAVARRTREIGIRLALGADPARLRSMILREGAGLALCSLALGLLLGLGAGRVLASMLNDLSAVDLLAFGLAAAASVSATLLACYLPARRATKVSPLTALRTD